MRRSTENPSVEAEEPEPAWEIAYLFPPQGQWSEEDYLALDTNRLLELCNGHLEMPSMPTTTHQFLVGYLYGMLLAFVTERDLGTTLFAPLRVRLWRGTIREPDVVFMLKEHRGRIGERFWRGADLVMEVVSQGAKDRRRDLREKRHDYARARIPEYWIVDPHEERITVLRFANKRYVVHGEFDRAQSATSALLPGFTVNVAEALSRSQLPAGNEGGKPQRRRRK